MEDKNQKHSEAGGAALEYLFVSLFALSISVLVLGLVGSTIKQRLDEMKEQFAIDLPDMEVLDGWASP